MKYIHLLFCTIFCALSHSIWGGFGAGTLVQTPSGPIPIEQLAVNDSVSTCSGTRLEQAVAKVTAITTELVETTYVVSFGQEIVVTSADQCFFVNNKKRWVPVNQLLTTDLLATSTHTTPINSIEKVSGRTVVYKLTVEPQHTFLITSECLIAHNFGFVIPLIAWGAGGITFFEGVTLASIASGIATAIILKKVQDTTGATINVEVGADGTMNGRPLPGMQSHEPPPATVEIWDNSPNQNIEQTTPQTGGGQQCWCGHPCHQYCNCCCGCGCGIIDRLENQPQFDNFKPEKDGTKEKPSNKYVHFTDHAIEEGIKYATTDSKIKHIFKKTMHNLKPLINHLGNNEDVVKEVLKQLSGKVEEGIFNDIKINIDGYEVYVRGRVMDGIPKIGTFFIK